MKNTIVDLNNYLFAQIERLDDDELSDEELDKALRRTEGIVHISEQIIQNNKVALSAVKYLSESGFDVSEDTAFLGIGNGK